MEARKKNRYVFSKLPYELKFWGKWLNCPVMPCFCISFGKVYKKKKSDRVGLVPQQEKPVDLYDQGLIIIRLSVAQKSASLIGFIYVLNISLGPTLQDTWNPLQTFHISKTNF